MSMRYGCRLGLQLPPPSQQLLSPRSGVYRLHSPSCCCSSSSGGGSSSSSWRTLGITTQITRTTTTSATTASAKTTVGKNHTQDNTNTIHNNCTVTAAAGTKRRRAVSVIVAGGFGATLAALLHAVWTEYEAELQTQQYVHRAAHCDNTATRTTASSTTSSPTQNMHITEDIHNTTNVHTIYNDYNNNNYSTNHVACLPRIYDWDAVDTYWSHRPIATLRRAWTIAYQLVPLFVAWYLLPPWLQTLVLRPLVPSNHDMNIEPTATTTHHENNNHHHQQQQQEQLWRAHAIAWRQACTHLGPAFVKAGQQVSIRPDLIPSVMIPELQSLCDAVTPIPDSIALDIICRELLRKHRSTTSSSSGVDSDNDDDDDIETMSLHTLFVDTPVRVAAASLGQVYRAKLRLRPTTTTRVRMNNNNDINDNNNDDNNNEETIVEVAIKVQRPDMLSSFSLDLYLLQRLSVVIDTFTSLLTNQPPFHKALYESFARGSYMELDYEHEAANQIFFRSHLMNTQTTTSSQSQWWWQWWWWWYNGSDDSSLTNPKLPNVVIPKVYPSYTTRTVLTTEWIEGTKLADAPPDQIRALIPVGVELFLTQLLDLGTFHADPHMGNLLVQAGTGKLCLLDFGLCAEIDETDRRALTVAMVHLLQRDFATLVHDDAKALGFLPPNCDTTDLLPVLTKILTVGLVESCSSNFRQRRRKLLEISNELNEVFFRYPFSVPPYFALVTRGLGLLEGIALTGDADFDIFQAATPFARRRAIQILGRTAFRRRRTTVQKPNETSTGT